MQHGQHLWSNGSMWLNIWEKKTEKDNSEAIIIFTSKFNMDVIGFTERVGSPVQQNLIFLFPSSGADTF